MKDFQAREERAAAQRGKRRTYGQPRLLKITIETRRASLAQMFGDTGTCTTHKHNSDTVPLGSCNF